jgi:hypothetical protein
MCVFISCKKEENLFLDWYQQDHVSLRHDLLQFGGLLYSLFGRKNFAENVHGSNNQSYYA